MASLTHQRCFNHASREAVARCPSCRKFYCRECVTEHDDRLICAACLAKQNNPAAKPARRFAAAIQTAQFLVGLLVLWLFFFRLGQDLLALPTSFHEDTLWHVHWSSNKPADK